MDQMGRRNDEEIRKYEDINFYIRKGKNDKNEAGLVIERGLESEIEEVKQARDRIAFDRVLLADV